jgi:hypothetical protein
MVTFRCQNCWASCETRRKTASHAKDKKCKPRIKPTDECFMDPGHEEHVKNTSRKASAEAIWWAMFRLLIRGIDGIKDTTLRAAYSPCKCQDWCLVRCAQNARASRRVAHKGATDKDLDRQKQQMGYLAMARGSLDQTDQFHISQLSTQAMHLFGHTF